MNNLQNWDDRYPLLNQKYLRYGVAQTSIDYAAGVTGAEAVILIIAAGLTITLPLASDFPGAVFYIKKTAAGAAATIARSGADLIDGAIAVSLPLQYDGVQIVSDGISAWSVLAKTSAAVLPVT